MRIATILLFVMATVTTAAATDTRTLVRSDLPYWKVGVVDQDLGRLCAVGQFNEVSMDRFVARFSGSTGAGVLGVAKGTGLNLKDPGHKANKSEDYFFFQDGTSSCAVYVGGRKNKKAGP